MILIWTGWGMLAILIIVGVAFAVALLLGMAAAMLGTGRFDTAALFIGFLAGAAVNWHVGRKMNGAAPRVLVDEATGERVTLRKRHTLFWVPMEYYSVVVVVLLVIAGISLLFVR